MDSDGEAGTLLGEPRAVRLPAPLSPASTGHRRFPTRMALALLVVAVNVGLACGLSVLLRLLGAPDESLRLLVQSRLAPEQPRGSADLLPAQTRSPLSTALDGALERGRGSLLSHASAPTVSASPPSVCVETKDRFGNQIYELMMGVLYAVKHRLRLYVPDVRVLLMFPTLQRFHAPCPIDSPPLLIPMSAAQTREPFGGGWYNEDPRNRSAATTFHVVLQGWFQYHTSIYQPFEGEIRALFQPDPRLVTALALLFDDLLQSLCAQSLLVAVHVRRGDFRAVFGDPTNSDPFKQLPTAWHLDWLRRLRTNDSEDTLRHAKRLQDQDCRVPLASLSFDSRHLVLLVISDEPAVVDDFRHGGFSVVTTTEIVQRVFGNWTALQGLAAAFYADWWLFGRSRVQGASHSTFSLTAALLSPHSSLLHKNDQVQAFFFRPSPEVGGLVAFDPWDFHYDHRAFVKD